MIYDLKKVNSDFKYQFLEFAIETRNTKHILEIKPIS